MGEPASILLVRLRHIGDVVFTTPAVHALRRRFPDAVITYLVEPAAAPIVAGNPHLTEVLVAPRRSGIGGLIADLTLGRQLRARRFDLAIDFHGGPRASLLTWLSGAPVRIGYEVAGRSWMYTQRVARSRHPRQRRQPIPALAVRAFRRVDRGARGRRPLAPHHRHVGTVGRGGSRARDRGRARSGRPRGGDAGSVVR